jgi:hypothetical protein
MEREVIESEELAHIIEETSPGPMIAAGTDVEPKRGPKTQAAPAPGGGPCVTPRTRPLDDPDPRDADGGQAVRTGEG